MRARTLLWLTGPNTLRDEAGGRHRLPLGAPDPSLAPEMRAARERVESATVVVRASASQTANAGGEIFRRRACAGDTLSSTGERGSRVPRVESEISEAGGQAQETADAERARAGTHRLDESVPLDLSARDGRPRERSRHG